MSHTLTIFRRELRGYFATPVAYVFIVIFLFLIGLFTFERSEFFNRGQADLAPFFNWHPWLYLFLIPAVAMRLWAEERKSGTIELLFTLPVTPAQAIVGKYLAAWLFIALALLLTFPIVFTVRYLGRPDMGVICAGYFGSLLLAGAFLAIGICMSALTRNQVISFILSVVLCLGFVLAGFGEVQDFFVRWAPVWLTDAILSVSALTHYMSIQRGVISLFDLIYFVVMIAGWLLACAIILEMKKSE